MYEPQIAICASRQLNSLFVGSFTETIPRQIALALSPGITKTLKWKPAVRHVEVVHSVESIYAAPSIIVYMFTATSKKEYDTHYRNRLLEFKQKFGRLGVGIVPIYVHDPKQKTKWGFSPSSMLSHVQIDNANVCLGRIKNNGEPKKDDLKKAWVTITNEVARNLKERVELASENIASNGTAEVFRHYLMLISMYESVECFKESFEIVKSACLRVRERGDLFKSFGSIHALSLGLDFDKPISETDGYILTSELHRLPVWRVFMRHGVLSLRKQNMVEEGITYALGWIREVLLFVETAVSKRCFYFWLAKVLRDVIVVCKEEIETTRRMRNVGEYALLWYLRVMPTLKSVVFETGGSWVVGHEAVDDPLSAAPSVTPEEADEFPDIYKLVESGETLKKEMDRWWALLLTVSMSLKHTRISSYVSRQLFVLDDYEEERQRGDLALVYATHNYAYMHKEILNSINTLPVPGQITVCCGVLSDRRTTIQERACAVLSEIMRSSKFDGVDMVASIPIHVRVLAGQEHAEGEETTLKVVFCCRFSGVIHCQRLSLSFISESQTKFYVDDFDLTHGAVAELKGRFATSGKFQIDRIFISCGTGMIKSHIPCWEESVTVGMRLPLVTLDVSMPRLLLPGCWQVALVTLNVVKPIENLMLKCSGLATQPAALRRQDKRVILPRNGFSFSEVPVGEHCIYLPVRPSVSGKLEIEVHAGETYAVHREMYTVSDFLNVELVYRCETRVAQLSLSMRAEEDIVLRDVKYFGSDGEEILCESIGVPHVIQMTQRSVFGILASDPLTADIILQQKGLEPFPLKLAVTHHKYIADLRPVAGAPLTIIVPQGFTMYADT